MIIEEIDWRAPLDAFAPFEGEAYAALLQSGGRSERAGWAFLAAMPSMTIELRGGRVVVDGKARGGSLTASLSEVLRRRTLTRPESGAPPFATGVAGFVGYDAASHVEPAAPARVTPFQLPEAALGIYDATVAFDLAAKSAFICARTPMAQERLRDRLGSRPRVRKPLPAFGPLASNFTRQAYCDAVSIVIERIRRGDLFQANLSQQLRFAASPGLCPDGSASVRREEALPLHELFDVAAQASSADHGALLQYKEGFLVSLSPERFFRIEPRAGGLWIVADPIKGTRPRGATPEEDDELRQNLQSDPKDRAENIMIADLTRNDLARLCRGEAVHEDRLCEVVTHETLHHMISRISARLPPGVGASEALGAMFPCGSITGAPKVEAMRLIAELEPAGRGPYCGAIGYIDDCGGAEFSVAIRTAIINRARDLVTLPVGGGVTLLSNPEAEYRETLVKAQGMLLPLGLNAMDLL